MSDKPTKYMLSRDGYAKVANVIMHYCVDELQMSQMQALPFVSNLAERLTPTIEAIIETAISKEDTPHE